MNASENHFPRPPVHWVLVADGRQAKIYQEHRAERHIPLAGNAVHHHARTDIEIGLAAVPDMAWRAETPDDYELGRQKVGMVFESSGKARHMNEPHIDARKEIKHDFAVSLATHLNAAKQSGLFDDLILVAAPRALGEIRRYLSKEVRGAVRAELDKDLTHCSEAELTAHLQDVL